MSRYKLKELLIKLQDEHTKYNQTVKDYKNEGEEDFETWLLNNVRRLFGDD